MYGGEEEGVATTWEGRGALSDGGGSERQDKGGGEGSDNGAMSVPEGYRLPRL